MHVRSERALRSIISCLTTIMTIFWFLDNLWSRSSSPQLSLRLFLSFFLLFWNYPFTFFIDFFFFVFCNSPWRPAFSLFWYRPTGLCPNGYTARYSEDSNTPKVRYSEGSLFRKSVIPKVHYSEGPLFRRFVNPKMKQGSLIRNWNKVR